MSYAEIVGWLTLGMIVGIVIGMIVGHFISSAERDEICRNCKNRRGNGNGESGNEREHSPGSTSFTITKTTETTYRKPYKYRSKNGRFASRRRNNFPQTKTKNNSKKRDN